MKLCIFCYWISWLFVSMQTCHLIAANLVHDYNWISLKLLRKMKNLNLIKQAHLHSKTCQQNHILKATHLTWQSKDQNALGILIQKRLYRKKIETLNLWFWSYILSMYLLFNDSFRIQWWNIEDFAPMWFYYQDGVILCLLSFLNWILGWGLSK